MGGQADKQGKLKRGPARMGLAAALALAAVFATPYMLRTNDTLFYSNSVFALVLFVLYAGLFYRFPGWVTKRRLFFTSPLGLVFSAMLVFGAALETTGDVALGAPSTWLATLGGAPLFCALLTLLWHALDRRRPGGKPPAEGGTRSAPDGAATPDKPDGPQTLSGRLARAWKRLGWWRWPLCWLFLLLCWLPVLLAAWPGFFTYDAMAQYNQYASGAFTGHHPPLHTFLLGFCVTFFGELLGGVNAGVTACLALQMMVVSACFVRTVHFLQRMGQPLWLRAGALLYYGLFPTVAMFACCTSKDTLFCALILLFVFQLWQALRDGKAFFAAPGRVLRLVLVAFLMLSLRNNAPYALLAALPVAAAAAKGTRLRLTAALGASVVLFALYSGPVLAALGVQPGDSREALSVPMQQLARVHQRAPETFIGEETEALYALIPEDYLNQYHPKLSDPVKQGFNTAALRQEPARYAQLWLAGGLRQPGVYLNAFLENTVDAWYPGSLVNGYNFDGPRERVFAVGGASYFYALIEPPATPDSKLPGLLRFYEALSYEVSWQKVPLVSLLFSPAFMAWVLLVCLSHLHYCRAHRAAAPLWFLLFLYATCLLGPIVQVRYLLYLYFCLPLFAGLLLNPGGFCGEEVAPLSGSTKKRPPT